MRTVNTDSNLSIVGRTEGEVFDSTSNLNYTVHIGTTLISIADLKSLAGNCSGLLDTVYRMTPVLNVDPGGLNFAPFGQNRLVVHARRHKDLHFGEFTSSLLLDLHLEPGHHCNVSLTLLVLGDGLLGSKLGGGHSKTLGDLGLRETLRLKVLDG